MTDILQEAAHLHAPNTVPGVANKNITLKQIDRAIKYPFFEWEDTEYVKLPNRVQQVGIPPTPPPPEDCESLLGEDGEKKEPRSEQSTALAAPEGSPEPKAKKKAKKTV